MALLHAPASNFARLTCCRVSQNNSKQRRGGCVHRLYGNALETQTKLAQAREARDAEVKLNAQASSHKMTWVSQELTKGRNTGEYSNYGERLYVEGMLDNEKKKAAVRYCLTSTNPFGRTPKCKIDIQLVKGEGLHGMRREGKGLAKIVSKRQTAV